VFVAQALGTNPDATVHVVIATISAIPDVLAVLLLLPRPDRHLRPQGQSSPSGQWA